MLDFSKKKSQIGQEFSSENDFEPRFSISLHCVASKFGADIVYSFKKLLNSIFHGTSRHPPLWD